MLLRKRPRGPMRRTTSMTGITGDVGHDEEGLAPSDPQDPIINFPVPGAKPEGDGPPRQNVVPMGPSGYDHRLMAALSPRYPVGSSGGGVGGAGDYIETAQFLRTCGLCKRRLASGRDIYMYRGDTAFCSQECREEQMKRDERNEKSIALASKKATETHHGHSTPPTAASETASTKSGTIAAA